MNTYDETDLHALSGAYALNALDELERARFERHLASCDACSGEVGEFLETAALLGAAEAEPAPAGLRAAVLEEISNTRQDRPVTQWPSVQLPRTAGWRDRIALPAAGILAILVVGLSAMVSGLNNRLSAVEATTENVTSVVAAADAQSWDVSADGGVAGRVVYSATRGEAVFVASGMASAPDGMAYALWFLDGEGDPRPAGLFDADDGRVVHRITADLAALDALAVTVEPEAGSPAPTSDPVMVVDLADDTGSL